MSKRMILKTRPCGGRLQRPFWAQAGDAAVATTAAGCGHQPLHYCGCGAAPEVETLGGLRPSWSGGTTMAAELAWHHRPRESVFATAPAAAVVGAGVAAAFPPKLWPAPLQGAVESVVVVKTP